MLDLNINSYKIGIDPLLTWTDGCCILYRIVANESLIITVIQIKIPEICILPIYITFTLIPSLCDKQWEITDVFDSFSKVSGCIIYSTAEII